MANLYSSSNKLLFVQNKAVSSVEAPVPTDIPEGTDFIYVANNYDNDYGIRNSVSTSTFGDLVNNSIPIIKNNSGTDCYLSLNDYSFYGDILCVREISDYYRNFYTLNTTNVYTYYCRVYTYNYTTGGIICYRDGNDSSYNYGDCYNYMIRTCYNAIQFHFGYGIETLDLIDGNVFKIEINVNDYMVYITDLTDGRTYSLEIDRGQSIPFTLNKKLTTIWAGFSSENGIDKWYGIAGIHRKTTEAEDTWFKNTLTNQNI